MVCARALTYLTHAEEMKCDYCQRSSRGYMRCTEGHYVCEDCHNKDALRIIKEVSFTNRWKDPLETAELMMSIPSLPMLGCQHAWIVGGALMSALKNTCPDVIDNRDIAEVFNRIAEQAKGGYCGLTGLCGITVAVGACVSLLSKSVCGTDKEQRITMNAVAKIARIISELTGPSCCKAYARASIESSIGIFQEDFGINLHISNSMSKCLYVEYHPHGCRGQKCPYFEKPKETP